MKQSGSLGTRQSGSLGTRQSGSLGMGLIHLLHIGQQQTATVCDYTHIPHTKRQVLSVVSRSQLSDYYQMAGRKRSV